MMYYNEHDPKTAAWLRQLIEFGALPKGIVDDRDVQQVRAEDLRGHDTCHFFAGIGGWPLALELAGWPTDWSVWSASLPCQPFSAAGKQRGTEDERHLWPVFRDLVEQCRPSTCFGEQVASKAGRAWLAAVQTDLEALGYSTAAADLCAAGIGAPHIRQRLYWCAIRVADTDGALPKLDHSRSCTPRVEPLSGIEGSTGNVLGDRGTSGGLEHANVPGWQGSAISPQAGPGKRVGRTGRASWDDVTYLPCADGKARPVKSGIKPLVDGLPGRVGLLRGYGNAIVPQVAQVFIEAVMDILVDAQKQWEAQFIEAGYCYTMHSKLGHTRYAAHTWEWYQDSNGMNDPDPGIRAEAQRLFEIGVAMANS